MIEIQTHHLTKRMLAILADYLDRYVDHAKNKTVALRPDEIYGKVIPFKVTSDIYQYVCNSNPNHYRYAVISRYLSKGEESTVDLSEISLKFSSNPDDPKLYAVEKTRVVKVTECGNPLTVESILTRNPLHRGKQATIIKQIMISDERIRTYAMFMAYFPYPTLEEIFK